MPSVPFMLRLLLAVISLAAVPEGAVPARAAEPLRVRMGWVTPASFIPLLVLKPEILRHNGVSYRIEATHFQGSSLQIAALQSGDIDIAALGFSSFAFAVENAGMTDLRIIGDEFRNGVPGYGGDGFQVLKDGPIHEIEDLKGKVLATNAIGGGADMIARTMLLKHGMIEKRDYSDVEVGFPNMNAVLLERKVDLVHSALPFSEAAEFQAKSRVLFTTGEAMGVVALSFWTARQPFIEKNRADLVDLLEDYVRVLHWYLDPRNHDEAVAIVAAFQKLPPSALQDWLFTGKDNYRNPDGLADLDAVSRNIHDQKQLGFIRADLDARRYADLTLIEDGARRVKGH